MEQEISGISKFPEKRTTSGGSPQFSKRISGNFGQMDRALYLLCSHHSGGVGHGSRDSIRPIKCRFSRSNGGHIFRFSTDFCARHENQTNIFWELLVQYLGQLFGNSQWQVSIFCINFSQWKLYYVENVCLSSMLDMDILLVVCGVTGISILDYFCVKF